MTSSSEPASTCSEPSSHSRQSRGGDAPRLLLDAARKLEPLDVRLSRDTYLEAWAAALFAGHLAGPAAACSTCPAPRRPPPIRPIRRFRAICCSTVSRCIFTEGRAAATPDAPARDRRVRERRGLRRGDAAVGLAGDAGGDLAVGLRQRPRDRRTRAVQLARDSGALEALAVADNACGQAAAFGGDFATRRPAGGRGRGASRRRPGAASRPYAAICARGLRGREAEASELIDARPRGEPPRRSREPPSSTRTGRTPCS